MKKSFWIGGALFAAIALASAAGAGQFDELESEIVEFTLDNGLKFLVLERPETPVFSFRTYVDAGGVDEVAGVTGIAHMFEHMAFKGTKTIGTSDYEAELDALEQVDEAWIAYATEESKGRRADAVKLDELEAAFKAAQSKAQEFVVSNEFTKILEENGVEGLNASTSTDLTWYYYSLPSNRLELWARLEGDRLTQPVLREFYVERDVVIEERRFQESSPTGRLFDELLTTAFRAHPYGTGIIGHSSDLERITRKDAFDFYNEYYVASNMTVTVVGDVQVEQVKEYAEKYFSKVPSGPKPLRVRTIEPEHMSEVRITREEDAQEIFSVSYHIPSRLDPNWYAYELLGDILVSGRSSRLYDRLVKKDQSCAQIFGGAGLPGNKYPNLLVFVGFVSADAGIATVEQTVADELARIVEEGPTPEELEKVKTMNKAAFVRGLRGDSGIAGSLAQYEGMLGDWRLLFDVPDQIDAVTVEDIHEAARAVLKKGNSVVGIIQKPTTGTSS